MVEWLRNLLQEFQTPILQPTIIYEDNMAAIRIAMNTNCAPSTSNINTKYHRTRQLLLQKIIEIYHIKTSDNIADIQTKPVPKSILNSVKNEIGLTPLSEYPQWGGMLVSGSVWNILVQSDDYMVNVLRDTL